MSRLYNPSPNDTNALRVKQIESLRAMYSMVKEVERHAVYDLPTSIGSRQITFRITLGPQFPTAPPTITIMPLLKHRLLDNRGVVLPEAHSNFKNWSYQVHLGRFMNDILGKFIDEPPVDFHPSYPGAAPATSPYPGPPPAAPSYAGTKASSQYPPTPPPKYGASYAAAAQPYSTQPPTITPPNAVPSRSVTPPGSLPPVSPQRPILTVDSLKIDWDSKTIEEMNELLQSDEKFDAFFYQLPAIQEDFKALADQRDANKKIAEKNIAMQAEVEQLAAELAVQQNKSNQKLRDIENAKQQQAAIQQQFSPHVLAVKLADAAKKVDRESEEISSKFQNGEISIAEFVKQYRDARVLYHLRSAKREMLLTQRT